MHLSFMLLTTTVSLFPHHHFLFTSPFLYHPTILFSSFFSTLPFLFFTSFPPHHSFTTSPLFYHLTIPLPPHHYFTISPFLYHLTIILPSHHSLITSPFLYHLTFLFPPHYSFTNSAFIFFTILFPPHDSSTTSPSFFLLTIPLLHHHSFSTSAFLFFTIPFYLSIPLPPHHPSSSLSPQLFRDCVCGGEEQAEGVSFDQRISSLVTSVTQQECRHVTSGLNPSHVVGFLTALSASVLHAEESLDCQTWRRIMSTVGKV